MVLKEDLGKLNCELLLFEDCKSFGYSYSKFLNLFKYKIFFKVLNELFVFFLKLKFECFFYLILFLCYLYFFFCFLYKVLVLLCWFFCKSVMNDCFLSSLKDMWFSYVICEYFL